MKRCADLAGLSHVDTETLAAMGVATEEDLSFLQFEDLPDKINVVKRRKLEIIGTYIASGLAIDGETSIQDIRTSVRTQLLSKQSISSAMSCGIHTKPLEYFDGDVANYEEWELRFRHQLNQTEFGKYLSVAPSLGNSIEKQRDKHLYNIILSSVRGGRVQSVVECTGTKGESGHQAWKALNKWYLKEIKQAGDISEKDELNRVDNKISAVKNIEKPHGTAKNKQRPRPKLLQAENFLPTQAHLENVIEEKNIDMAIMHLEYIQNHARLRTQLMISRQKLILLVDKTKEHFINDEKLVALAENVTKLIEKKYEEKVDKEVKDKFSKSEEGDHKGAYFSPNLESLTHDTPSCADGTRGNNRNGVYFHPEKDKILNRLDASLKNDFREIGFAIWNRKCVPIIQLSPYDTNYSIVRSEWMRIYKVVTKSKKKIEIPRLVYLYGTKRDNLSHAYCFVPKKAVMSYEEGVRKGYHNLSEHIKEKIDNGEQLTKDEKLIQNGLEEQQNELLLPKKDRIAWISRTEDNLKSSHSIATRNELYRTKESRSVGRDEKSRKNKKSNSDIWGAFARFGQKFSRNKGKGS